MQPILSGRAVIRALVTALLVVSSLLTPRWTPLRPHAVQSAFWNSTARFNTLPAGRRSGKTELEKRKLIKRALRGTQFFPARFAATAPTHHQAKRIYWQDLKLLVPRVFLGGKPSESELVIRLVNGSEIHVIGMDEPARIEGTPWDGLVLDEIANMKPHVFEAHVEPALADRGGWCDFPGVPEGRNHFYKLVQKARADATGQWAHFTWKSADILSPAVIETARRNLDPLLFEQEYEASFVSFEGRAYYAFTSETHCAPLTYDPDRDLIVCLDFNISPGVAAIAQEQRLPRRGASGAWELANDAALGTGVIGEVYIPSGSNTRIVCRKILTEYREHRGQVLVYGDATGGAGGTAQVMGSDLELVRKYLHGGVVDGSERTPGFGDRLVMRVPIDNPAERSRVNAVNVRLMNGAGEVRLMVDPRKAPHVVEDFEGVRLVEGGSGEIDHKKDKMLVHISTALGYYVVAKFPVTPSTDGVEEWLA